MAMPVWLKFLLLHVKWYRMKHYLRSYVPANFPARLSHENLKRYKMASSSFFVFLQFILDASTMESYRIASSFLCSCKFFSTLRHLHWHRMTRVHCFCATAMFIVALRHMEFIIPSLSSVPAIPVNWWNR